MAAEPQNVDIQTSIDRVNYESITTQSQLAELCRRLADAEVIGFDTEFVSEDTYWPELCLVQVATADHLAVIDTMELSDLDPFWTALADGDHQTVVHAGRQELLFSLEAIERRPANLLDIQIVAGLVGNEYPAGYGSLVNKFLGQKLPKGETRTDWRRRPLTDRQIKYALADVEYLLPLAETLRTMLEQRSRQAWAEEELSVWQDEVDASRHRARWRKVSGSSGLPPRAMAIVRGLWHWREDKAKSTNKPARRILRDDLIIELARRASSDPQRIRGIRGLDRSGARRHISAISTAIESALAEPVDNLLRTPRRNAPDQLQLLGQVLTAALMSICRRAQVATSLAGTASDVRELVANRLGFADADSQGPPTLTVGWRAEVVGNALDDLLAGRVAMRIQNPRSSQPLSFDVISNGDDSPGDA